MLVTFSSSNSPNIMMFGDVAKQFLTMMGHSANIPGAILATDVSTSLNRLENELANTDESALSHTDQHGGDKEQQAEPSLKKRALPLIDLLKQALRNNSDVMWK